VVEKRGSLMTPSHLSPGVELDMSCAGLVFAAAYLCEAGGIPHANQERYKVTLSRKLWKDIAL
jgi:hypothetical protein